MEQPDAAAPHRAAGKPASRSRSAFAFAARRGERSRFPPAAPAGQWWRDRTGEGPDRRHAEGAEMRRAPADLLGLGSRDLKGRRRIRLLMLTFAMIFLVIAGKLAILSLLPREEKLPGGAEAQKMPRPDIVDRNGEVLARDIRVASLYAEPNKLIDIDEAVELLTANVPDLDARELRRKLSLDRSFIWLKRQVSPSEQQLIHDLGIPGIGFRDETLRIYPRGRLAAHVLGYVDVDSHGLAGIVKYLDGRGALYAASLADPASRSLDPVQ